MLVVDASALAVALADDGPDGDAARTRLRAETLTAPEPVGLEVASVLRLHDRAGLLDTRRANLALTDLAALPIRRVSHVALLARCWELRPDLTPHDAAYVALAEALDATVLCRGCGRRARWSAGGGGRGSAHRGGGHRHPVRW